MERPIYLELDTFVLSEPSLTGLEWHFVKLGESSCYAAESIDHLKKYLRLFCDPMMSGEFARGLSKLESIAETN